MAGSRSQPLPYEEGREADSQPVLHGDGSHQAYVGKCGNSREVSKTSDFINLNLLCNMCKDGVRVDVSFVIPSDQISACLGCIPKATLAQVQQMNGTIGEAKATSKETSTEEDLAILDEVISEDLLCRSKTTPK